MEKRVINELVKIWTNMVENGEFDAEEMEISLEEQVDACTQGWDASIEDLECNPHLAEWLGWDLEDLTEEQIDEWQKMVTEAAKIYLNK